MPTIDPASRDAVSVLEERARRYFRTALEVATEETLHEALRLNLSHLDLDDIAPIVRDALERARESSALLAD